jgi:DNA-binding Lrp family transcriptional regulator
VDDVDLFILERLTADARTSFRSIARELDVSPDTIISRCKRMAAEGVIRGSTAVVDPRKLGYEGMVAIHIDMSPSSYPGE